MYITRLINYELAMRRIVLRNPLIAWLLISILRPGGPGLAPDYQCQNKSELSGRLYGLPSRERLPTQNGQGLCLGSAALAQFKQPLRL